MFGNFIYFIIALLIYATYQPSEEAFFHPYESLLLFFSLIIVFACFCRIQFSRIEKQFSKNSFARLDHKFNAALNRQFVMAIALFAIDIYGLQITSFLTDIALLSFIPTLEALFFLGIFISYLAIVWASAHRVYQRLYRTDLSKKSYILSNISFSVPVLLPWLLLSGIADLIQALPFDFAKRLLDTTEGQIIYFLVFLFVVAIIGPALIQKFWRCRPLEAGYTRHRIEDLCRKAGLQYRNILYWPIFGGRMITAGVMGLIKKFRYILVTQALLRFLEPEEIDAVIAHEIGHVKRKHLLFYLLFFAGYMILIFSSINLIIYSIYSTKLFFWFTIKTGSNETTVTSITYCIVFLLIFIAYFRYIFGYFMRNFERQADISVYALFSSAQPLISTLEKITETSGQPADKPNWHHFSIQERIDYLKKCEDNKAWISRHDRKVRKSIAVYIVGILLMANIGYSLNFGEAGEILNQHFVEKRLKLNQQYFERLIYDELSKTPNNANLYNTLGDLYYSIQDYEQTIAAYRQALELDPGNARVLNNLAWLYATCDDERFRDPHNAVVLAERALKIKEAPHILDTLAEAYFVNDRIAAAIAAEKRALALAKKNRAYYKDQLKRFETAADK